MSRLLSHDPLTGITRTHHYDHAEDKFTIATSQDITALVDENKRAWNEAPTRMGHDFVRVGQIPMTLYYDLKQKGILDDPERLKKWLNDPDNRVFRTRPGRV